MSAHPAPADAPLEPKHGLFEATELGFALRTTLAGMAALFVAMWMQIDTPRWAIWTVFIVSPPVRGNALRKTAARIVGTIIGCIAGVAAVAVFPQERAGFYLLLSLWIGGCAYWATLRRGYVSYAASLAAFTAAIVSAGVSAAPQAVWQTAMDRGCATMLGILFALLASNAAAMTDDVPGDLAKHLRTIAADLLEWAGKQLPVGGAAAPRDAPLTAKLFSLDESCINSLAERPALRRIKPWIVGAPTALLALQSAVLSLRDVHTARLAADVLHGVADFLRSGAAGELPALARQSDALRMLRKSQAGQAPAMRQTIDALLYLLGSLQALLTFGPPDPATPLYPAPQFPARRSAATINMIRAIVGILAGFLIWDLTAWPEGPVFMVNIAVAVVIFVTIEDPIVALWGAVVGATVGGVMALCLKYLFLISFNQPLNLVLVLFPLLFIGAWIETTGEMGPLGLILIISLLVIIEPANPQAYDFAHDVNLLLAIQTAFTFMALVFLAIGTPKKGAARIAEHLVRMRRRRWSALETRTREQCLGWETQMYDELQRLQSATKDARHRRHGIHLLLSGRKLFNSDAYAGEAAVH